MKTILKDSLGTKTSRNQKKIIVAWNNYEELKSIDNEDIRAMTR